MARRGNLLKAVRVALGPATAADLWDRLAQLYGRQDFLTLAEPVGWRFLHARSLSYEDMADLVARLAGGLRALGVRQGDAVALCGDNRIDYAAALFAILRLGAVAVPLHHHLRADEIKEHVKRAKAKFLVAEGEAAVRMRGVKTISLTPGGNLDEAAAASRPHAPVVIDPSDTVVVLFTSGTTGAPKGAQLSSRALLAVARLAALMPDGAAEQGVCALPLAHIMGLSTLLASALAGTRMHWFARFDAVAVLRALERREATFFVGVPAMYAMLAELGPESADLSNVRLWVSGADAMPPSLVERFRRLGCAYKSPLGTRLVTAAFAEIYGMVELSGPAILRFTPPSPLTPTIRVPVGRLSERFSATAKALGSRLPGLTRSAANPRRGYTVPIPPYRIRVVDERGKTVPYGVVGELVVKGPGVTKGYLNDAEATARTTKDGWLFTGDLARRNRLGQVTFVSRKKDVVKHGGFSVFPAEVEAKIAQHPAVAEAIVFGAPHPTKGAVPVAVVVKKNEADESEKALLDWCRSNLAPYKAPRGLLFLESADIPRNDNRKVLKDALAEQTLPTMRSRYASAFESRRA